MKKTIAILLVAIMALTVISSAGIVAAAPHDNHGKRIDDRDRHRDRDRFRDPCIKLIKIKFHHRWIWIPVNICRAHFDRFDRFDRFERL
jgi:hypothetical protein